MSTTCRFFLAVLSIVCVAAGGQIQAAPPQLTPSAAAQVHAIQTIKRSKSPVQDKIDSRLYLGMLHRKGDPRLALLTDFRFVTPDADGRVHVDIPLVDGTAMKPLLNALEAMDNIVLAKSHTYLVVSARVHLEDLETLAAISGVRKIRQHIPGMTHSLAPAKPAPGKMLDPTPAASDATISGALPKMIHAVNVSEGDKTHGADAARGYFGVDGTGIKVCVISDGVDSLASLVASGDLPPTVDVLPGQAGSGDEGSAMLEIVHDLAPGADLGFATANPDQATFAQNILDLASAGCDIIVDDIIYLAESPFQDGPIAQAVSTVTTAGVLYFSSAGNEGNKNDATSGTWEGDFLASTAGDPGPLAGTDLHDFGDGGNSILITSGGGNPPLLIWAEHYDLSTGTASTDFDLYDMNGGLTTIFDASTDVQDGSGGDDFPIEFIGGGAFSGERLLIDRFAAGTTSSTPAFNLIMFRGELDSPRSTSAATRGHSSATDAYSVAATPAAASFNGLDDGPYPGLFTGANKTEVFSSDGLRRILLDPAGNELTPGNRTSTGGVVRQKPDITAADGVATAAPGFNPFYGTSAAAPHAAAIAALVKAAVPGITPAQMRTALLSSAIDIEAAGVDRDTGAGIVMAHAAIVAAGGVPQAFLAGQTPAPTQVAGDGDAFIEANEDWSLVIPLTNIGGTSATAISATLATTTPGITIYSATSTYPDLAAAATAGNATPYTFHVGSMATCGADINFQLTVTYTGGSSPQVFNYAIRMGAPGTPVTYSYTGAVVPIPDGVDLTGSAPGAAADAALAVAGSGNVYDINLSIDGAACSATAGSTTVGIDHSFVNDLEISLVSAAGTVVKVIEQTDGGGNNFCQTVLDDESAGPSIQSVTSSAAPFTGSFTPNVPLVFYGEDANGTWLLRAQDFFSQDTGNIRAWSLSITPAVCDAPVQPAQLAATKSVSGTFTEGGTITYTIVVTNTGSGIQPDNAGDELSDLLPAGLTLGTPTATAGTVSGAGINPVTWNGSLLPGAAVTITIPATINAGTAGTTISNQATLNFDADRDGTNEANAVSDDPGTGATGDPTAFVVLQGTLTISPAALAFGNQPISTTSAPMSVTLANTGGASLDVTALTVATAPFARIGGSCSASLPITIAPGASCTLSYQFAPTATGPFSQTLSVTANAPGSGTIVLSGTGTQGNLTIAPTTLAFGDQAVGTTSSQLLVTLGNSGTASLDVTALTAAAAPFARTGGTCASSLPITIAAGASCTIGYSFAPTVAGPASQALTISANAPGSGTVTLSGNGTQATLSISPLQPMFPNVFVGTNASAPVTITNTGTGNLTVNSISAPAAPFSVTGGTCGPAPFTLGAGASCTIIYTFAPSAAGTFDQTLIVSSDVGDGQILLHAVAQRMTPIPTLSDLGRLLLMLALGSIAFTTLRRRA